MTCSGPWIDRLGLTPSPIGGWFAAAAASDEFVPGSALPARFDGVHRFYSSNWYLLEAGEVLRLHSLKQDELWFFHLGDVVILHVFSANEYSKLTIGADVAAGHSVHAMAPHPTWFGAETIGSGFALVSCGLSPGWVPSDHRLAPPEVVAKLLRQFPTQTEVIRRLTGS